MIAAFWPLIVTAVQASDCGNFRLRMSPSVTPRFPLAGPKLLPKIVTREFPFQAGCKDAAFTIPEMEGFCVRLQGAEMRRTVVKIRSPLLVPSPFAAFPAA